MPTHHDDELPTLALADLAHVTGGAGDDMSAMLPMMLMMRNRSAQAAPAAAPAPEPWKPKILVNGVEQSLTNNGAGQFSTTTDADDLDSF